MMNKEGTLYIIKVVLLFLVISYVADKVVYLGLTKISNKVYSGESVGKLNQFLEIKDSLDFVVFGSSRANHNIDPQRISPNGFNMGVNGTNIAYSASLIKVLPKHKNQTILLHMDPEQVFDNSYTGDDVNGLAIKYNTNKTFRKEIDKLHKNNRLQEFYWSLSYNGNVAGLLKNYFRPNYNYKKYNGYDPIHVSQIQKEIFQNILAKEDTIICQENLSLNPIYADYLDEIMQFCQSNGKRLILYTSPEYDDRCKEDNLKFGEMMKKENVTYYDFTDYFRKHNSMDYWKDRGHLSNIGSEIFTDTIASLVAKKVAL